MPVHVGSPGCAVFIGEGNGTVTTGQARVRVAEGPHLLSVWLSQIDLSYPPILFAKVQAGDRLHQSDTPT